MVQVWFFSAK